MKRIARWSLNALTVLSLLLCVATVMLWARSHRRWDLFGADSVRLEPSGASGGEGRVDARTLEAQSRDGQLSFQWHHASLRVAEEYGSVEQFRASHRHGVEPFWVTLGEPQHPPPSRASVWKLMGFDYFALRSPGDRSYVVYAPHWSVVLALASLPLARGVATWSRRRRRPGTCPACSYDLIGNVSGVCPECGTSIAKGNA